MWPRRRISWRLRRCCRIASGLGIHGGESDSGGRGSGSGVYWLFRLELQAVMICSLVCHGDMAAKLSLDTAVLSDNGYCPACTTDCPVLLQAPAIPRDNICAPICGLQLKIFVSGPATVPPGGITSAALAPRSCTPDKNHRDLNGSHQTSFAGDSRFPARKHGVVQEIWGGYNFIIGTGPPPMVPHTLIRTSRP
jgi:hypothetical protein